MSKISPYSKKLLLLNLIQHNNRFQLVNRFDLKNYKLQFNNPEEHFVVSYQVANNLLCEKKLKYIMMNTNQQNLVFHISKEKLLM